MLRCLMLHETLFQVNHSASCFHGLPLGIVSLANSSSGSSGSERNSLSFFSFRDSVVLRSLCQTRQEVSCVRQGPFPTGVVQGKEGKPRLVVLPRNRVTTVVSQISCCLLSMGPFRLDQFIIVVYEWSDLS